MPDAYHLPPRNKDNGDRQIDPLIAKKARIGSGVSDGSIYDFDVPHRGSNAMIWMSIIVVATVALLLLSLFFHIF